MLLHTLQKQPNSKLKTATRQLLGSLPLGFALADRVLACLAKRALSLSKKCSVLFSFHTQVPYRSDLV
jgi:hypothetical protein